MATDCFLLLLSSPLLCNTHGVVKSSLAPRSQAKELTFTKTGNWGELMKWQCWKTKLLLLSFFVWGSLSLGQSQVPATVRAQAQALEQASRGTATISYHAKTGRIRFFGTDTANAVRVTKMTGSALAGTSEEDTAREFLAQFAPAFGVTDPKAELAVMKKRALPDGASVVRFQQQWRGLPVIGGELIVHQTKERAVTCVIGEASPELDLDPVPTVGATAASQVAIELVAKYYGVDAAALTATDPVLSAFDPALLSVPGRTKPALVWQMEITDDGTVPVREYVLIDAHAAKPVLHFSKIYHAKNRKTYSCNNTSILPGTLMREEGQAPVSDADVNAAHDGAGATYDFYWDILGRDSIDNAGMILMSSVRYCPSSSQCPYENAFWNGTQMVYGRDMTADDVCAHELTHGVTEHESKLFYYMQSGAINEAMSDIFGEIVDQVNGLGTDTPAVRWKLGEDLPGSIGIIRDMADPTAYGQPDKMSSGLYYCGAGDLGGVHTNSGVANKCAYLMADGGTFNGYTINSMGLYKTARIWYEVNCNYLTSAADFQDLYDALIQATRALVDTTVNDYGAGQTITSADVQNVKNAVDAVEMNLAPTGCAAVEAAYCSSDGKAPNWIWFDDLENPSSGRWVRGYAIGGNRWYYPQNTHPYTGFDATYATSGQYNFFGDDDSVRTDSWISMTQSVALPTTASAIYMHFRHAYDFEAPTYDGGVIEYSVDGGVTWLDAGSLIDTNGYTGTITTGFLNPLAGRSAFCGTSNGYISTRLNLTDLAGQNIRFRFRIGTDTSGYGWGWFIDDIGIYVCSYRVEEKQRETFTALPSGWMEFVKIPSSGSYAGTSYDATSGTLRAWVSAAPDRYRIVGWLAGASQWLNYSQVGTNNYVRAKFYVYAGGQSDPSQLNSIPNFRLRVSHRFALNSMLEVLPHSSATAGDEPVSLELRPSTDPTRPSLYRVDLAPIDIPYLQQNPAQEGFTHGFEIYALDPQDNGYIALTESSLGVYPRAAVSVSGSNLMWLKTYAPSSTDAGTLNPYLSGATLDRFSLLMYPDGVFPTRDNSVAPTVSAGTGGVTMDSTSFDNEGGSRVGVVAIDFDAGSNLAQRVRINENKQYMVRFHVTSTQQSNRNPQLRMRARTVRFAWTQKYEVGGAWAINTTEHSTIAAQYLPGVGCGNPDKIGAEFGGWYTLLTHSPLNIDIRPDVSGLLSSRMPNLSSQPGPGVNAPSLRDLKVGVDLLDTMSGSVNAYLEAGRFTVDRIEVFQFDMIPD